MPPSPSPHSPSHLQWTRILSLPHAMWISLQRALLFNRKRENTFGIFQIHLEFFDAQSHIPSPQSSASIKFAWFHIYQMFLSQNQMTVYGNCDNEKQKDNFKY